MQSAATGRRGHRRVPAVVCVLLGLLPALLGCATAAGGAPGAGSVPSGAVASAAAVSAGVLPAGAASAEGEASARPVPAGAEASARPVPVEAVPAGAEAEASVRSVSAGAVSPVPVVDTLRDGVPGCGRSGAPGEDGGAVPGTPARGASVYELLPGLHQVPVLTGGALPPAACAGPGFVTHRGPPPVEPPTPVGLSVLRV